MQVASIDRFEGDYVVCELENGDMIDIPKNKFQYEVEEGEIINVEVICKEGKIADVIVYEKNEEEKQRRLQIIKEKLNRLKRK